jgi:hypothetical protein
MLKGYCRSPPFPHKELACIKINPMAYYDELHSFEMYLDNEENFSAADLHNQDVGRYNRIKNCSHLWNLEEVKHLIVNG